MLTLEKAQAMVESVEKTEKNEKTAEKEPEIKKESIDESVNKDVKTYSLSEVARYLKVSENRIRHWEKTFSQVLSNHRNQYNHRVFTENDVKAIERIKVLQDSKLYTKEGILAKLNSKTGSQNKAKAQEITKADRAYQQKLLIALNSLASEIKCLRREVREDLKGELKKELDALTLMLFPPKKEKKWYEFWKE
ncbi:MAG: MerR family transcriptional regulator [Patescibacteria group bacterium]|nr:MerR family transcriptional regulator [Patescibacteria group bacterium]